MTKCPHQLVTHNNKPQIINRTQNRLRKKKLLLRAVGLVAQDLDDIFQIKEARRPMKRQRHLSLEITKKDSLISQWSKSLQSFKYINQLSNLHFKSKDRVTSLKNNQDQFRGRDIFKLRHQSHMLTYHEIEVHQQLTQIR